MPSDDLNFMAGYESGSNLDTLPSTPYNPNNWQVPLPGGGQSGSALSGVNWGKVAATGIPIAASLFAGDRPNITPQIGEVQKGARDTGAAGKELRQQGQDALHPALKYFQDLLSGNPADVMAATAPDRRRVIDQYDTARRSAAEFTPRGGGQSSTQQQLRGREAGDLATLGAESRREAAGASASLGFSEIRAGISAEEQSQQQLAQMLGPLFEQQKSDSDSTLQTIAGIASLAAMFI